MHVVEAQKAGLEPDIIAALKAGVRPPFQRADDRAVYDYSQELLTNRVVSEAAFAAAVAELGELGVVELTGILGYYGFISMTHQGVRDRRARRRAGAVRGVLGPAHARPLKATADHLRFRVLAASSRILWKAAAGGRQGAPGRLDPNQVQETSAARRWG